MQHLQSNTTLQGGKYRIERVLGQGGFGITYLAQQTLVGGTIVVKEFFMKDYCTRDNATSAVLPPTSGSRVLVELYRKKFIKEARNLLRLHHPNIINVMDVFEENDTVYYVMPYLSGGSLQDYVKAHGVLTESKALKYIRQIASALKYMHEKEHICHFDVKPANIILDNNDNAILIDFGISKNYDASGHQTTSTPVGVSEGYAPIEQYQQNVDEFSPASDVYALGATLFYLLHGKRPVSAVHRASGIVLYMSKRLSQGTKDIINASMKLPKYERSQSVDIFLEGTASESEETVCQNLSNNDYNDVIMVNNHAAVDLGLSVRWATMDIGASSETESGDGFLWGDPDGSKTKSVQTSFWARWFKGRPNIDKISGNPQYDTATYMWGSGWRIPTGKEYEELFTKCSWEFIDSDHARLIGPNGNSVIIDNNIHWTGEARFGYLIMVYWTSQNNEIFWSLPSTRETDKTYTELRFPIRPVASK